MTIEEIIEVLIIERSCVERQDTSFCDRHCANCDLCLPTGKVVKAYEQAIDQMHKIGKYRKKAKRWKRKYLKLSQEPCAENIKKEAIEYIKTYRKLDEDLYNAAEKGSVAYIAAGKCLKYWDMAIQALSSWEKYSDKLWKEAYERGKAEALSQEPTDAQERYEDLCEYFGDAKDILKNREDFKAWLDRIRWHIHKAEELYEKYEYKKEPCTDAVSRQAALNSLIDNTHLDGYDLAEALDAIENKEKLPPVMQKPETVTEFADRCRECGARYGKLLKQKSGKWIDYRDDGFVECPFCGHATNCEDDIDELHYCFYCGAKMVEPQERSDKE